MNDIMFNKIKKVLFTVIILLIIVVSAGVYYFNDYYHADESALKDVYQTENISVINVDTGLFLDSENNDTAIIFYPGAKVEYTAYLPLLMNISKNNVDCFIVEMPFNFVLFAPDKADEIINKYNYTNWYMSGHSLGGVAASSYTNKHNDKIKGLILIASYPNEKIENTSVLTIYGSNDNVITKDKYEKTEKYMPSNYTKYVIDGANHAQFASYGNQSGDGVANINPQLQKNITVTKIMEFINEV